MTDEVIINLLNYAILRIVIIIVIISEVLLLHSAVDKSEKDFRKYIFYAFVSICMISISALLFGDIGGPYEHLFQAGAALSGFINMAILFLLVKILI